MDQDPDKGASLSVVRRHGMCTRWQRAAVAVTTPHVVQAPPPAAPPPADPPPATQKKRKPVPAEVAEKLMPARAAVPYKEIVAAYHEFMPNNPRVRVMSDMTKGFVRSRWNEDKDRQRIEWWQDYFRYCNTCPLLVGKVDRRDAPPWIADFQWLVRPTNMEKVINGNYQ